MANGSEKQNAINPRAPQWHPNYPSLYNQSGKQFQVETS